jgi:1,2-phenylacetyl-CoA epoxidase catalytic subunit
LPDWADTIARHYLYELADELRIAKLRDSDDDEVAGLAAKIEREETYHRIHAQMWADRLAGEPRFVAAVDRLWPGSVALLDEDLRPQLAKRAGRDLPSTTGLLGLERGAHTDELAELWDEMTSVRRSVPGATW